MRSASSAERKRAFFRQMLRRVRMGRAYSKKAPDRSEAFFVYGGLWLCVDQRPGGAPRSEVDSVIVVVVVERRGEFGRGAFFALAVAAFTTRATVVRPSSHHLRQDHGRHLHGCVDTIAAVVALAAVGSPGLKEAGGFNVRLARLYDNNAVGAEAGKANDLTSPLAIGPDDRAGPKALLFRRSVRN